jgi:hypothetical protein
LIEQAPEDKALVQVEGRAFALPATMY